MKTVILTLSPLPSSAPPHLQKPNPMFQLKKQAKSLKPQAFQKQNMAGKVTATQVKSPPIKTSMVTV